MQQLQVLVSFFLFLVVAPASCTVLLISIDGFKLSYLDANNPQAPKSFNLTTISKLMSEGFSAKEGVIGVTPTVTYPSHTTLITGANPNQHGILDNTIFDPERKHSSWPPPAGKYQEWYWNYTSIHSKTLFKAVKENGGSTASVFWPVTVGAESDIDHLVPEIWPGNYIARYSKGAESAQDILDGLGSDILLLNDTMRYQLASRFLDLKPTLLAVHFAELDSQQHAHGVDSPEAFAALALIDSLISKLMDQMGKMGILQKSTIALVSDHGFGDVHTFVYPNTVFESRKKAGIPWEITAWTAGGSAGIYLNDQASIDAKKFVDDLLADENTMNLWGVSQILPGNMSSELGGWKGAYRILNLKLGYEFQSSAGGPTTAPATSHKATHGYPPTYPEMRCNLILWGNGIQPKSSASEPLYSVQIAPTLAKVLGVSLDQYQPAIPQTRTLIDSAFIRPFVRTKPLYIASAFGIIVVVIGIAATLTILNKKPAQK